jgi:hypothetical protein
MSVTQIHRNVAGSAVVHHLLAALDDAEQLCDDYNASPQLSAAISSLYTLLDAMRFGECGQEVDDTLAVMVRAALPEAGVPESTIEFIEWRMQNQDAELVEFYGRKA